MGPGRRWLGIAAGVAAVADFVFALLVHFDVV